MKRCGKVPYYGPLDAKLALARIRAREAKHRKQTETRRAQARIYFHADCGRWHITSERKRSAA